MLHVATHLQSWGFLPNCWSLERKHKTILKVANQTKNLTGFSLSLLEECLAHAWTICQGALRRWQHHFFRNRVKKGSALYLIHEDVTYEVAFVTRCPSVCKRSRAPCWETRCSPRTRMLTRMFMVQMSKHIERKTSYIDVASCGSKCRVWSVKCRVWSVKRRV